MTNQPSTKLGGYLFIAAGCIFMITAVTGKQNTFYALGALFLVLGIGYLARR